MKDLHHPIRYLTAILFLLMPVATGAETKPVYHVYLAGPEVFLPEPVKAGEDKKDLIKRLNEQHDWPFRLVGLYPLDNEIPDFGPDRETGWRIYRANIALMDKAHVIAANMVRFRGPSMDVGTAFEMGYMRDRLKAGVRLLRDGCRCTVKAIFRACTRPEWRLSLGNWTQRIGESDVDVAVCREFCHGRQSHDDSPALRG